MLALASGILYQGVQRGDVFLLLFDLRRHLVDLLLGEFLQHTFLQGALVHTVQALGVENLAGNDLAVLLAENQIALAVQKLIDFIDDDYRTISDRTEAMLDLMNDYPSYAGRSENMTGVTAFVIRTEAVEAPEAE